MALEIHYRSGSYNGRSQAVSLDLFAIRADGVYEEVAPEAQWSSSDPGAVSPPSPPSRSTHGTIPGATALITASYKGFTASLPFTVGPTTPWSPPYLEILGAAPGRPGQTVNLRAQLRRSITFNDVQDVTALTTWVSSSPRVASVDAAGRLTAHEPGTVRLTAAYGAFTALWGFSWTWTDFVRPTQTAGLPDTYRHGVAAPWLEAFTVEISTAPAASIYFAVLDRHQRLISTVPLPATRIYQGGPPGATFSATVTPASDSGELCSLVMLVTDAGTRRPSWAGAAPWVDCVVPLASGARRMRGCRDLRRARSRLHIRRRGPAFLGHVRAAL